MSLCLDLDDVLAGWEHAPGELGARLTKSLDGREVAQLRVDLGLLQLELDETRPDGQRYRGFPSVREFIQRELHIGRQPINAIHWEALDREITQLNYRRLALTDIADEAIVDEDDDLARPQLTRVLRDIAVLQDNLRLRRDHAGSAGNFASLVPTLVFHDARLRCHLLVLNEDPDAAVETAERGAEALEGLLEEVVDSDVLDEAEPENLGAAFLRDLAKQVRSKHCVGQTLREQLQAALDDENYELAARLHAELNARSSADTRNDARGGAVSSA